MAMGHWGKRFVASAGLVILGIAATSAWAARDWALVDIGTLGGPGSYGAAVSNSGVVVGCSDTASGGTHAFIYRDGEMQDLGTGTDSPAGDSCALAVNDAGAAAGRSATGELVIWNHRSITRLGVSGSVGDINNAGVVVGSYVEGSGNRAFVFAHGVLTNLGTLDDRDPYASSAATSINGRNQIVGTSNGHAFLHEGGSMRDLGTLGGRSSAARGINAKGEIVGMSSDEFGVPTPFIYDGAMQALPAPSYSAAIAINNRGQIVGSAEGTYGYLIENGEVTRLDRLPAVVSKGWRHLEPTGINNRGWIVGTAQTPEGDLRAFLLVPQNEAASISKPRRVARR
jgi:probable HAF family extracellular repeat protein